VGAGRRQFRFLAGAQLREHGVPCTPRIWRDALYVEAAALLPVTIPFLDRRELDDGFFRREASGLQFAVGRRGKVFDELKLCERQRTLSEISTNFPARHLGALPCKNGSNRRRFFAKGAQKADALQRR
jgi:hypothetical protein